MYSAVTTENDYERSLAESVYKLQMHKKDPNYLLRLTQEVPVKTQSEIAYESLIEQLNQ